jgi:2'-5' RNA ligase
MAHTTRTFVALEIPVDKGAKLERLQALIAPDAPGARWLEPRHLHVTLTFLGDVDDTELNTVCRAVQHAAAEFEPLELSLLGLGAFPDPKKPRAIWVGLTGPALGALEEMRRAIADAVGKVGYPPTDDRFTPHVTIGRVKTGRGPGVDLSGAVRQHAGWSAGLFLVAEVVTYASTPLPEGPSYTALARAPLLGKKRGAST